MQSISSEGIVDQLVELVDSNQNDSFQAARKAVLQLETNEIESITADLKQRALFYLRRDAPKAIAIADLILNIGEWRDTPTVRALGLQTKATTLTLSQHDFEAALDLYAESEAIYKNLDADLDIATGMISQVWALACLQRFDEAFSTAKWAQEVLTEHNAYLSLAALNNNLAAIYGRRGQDEEALQRIYDVEIAYTLSGEEGRLRLPLAHTNRAILLRNLGRFTESIAANKTALKQATKFKQTANIARAEQNLGITYFLIGRINEAHALLEKARDTFISDQRYRDAVLVELSITEGLLHLGRYEDALAKCRQIRGTFREAGTQFEVAQSILNEATALIGLHAYDDSLSSLDNARQIFKDEKNDAWQAYTDLEEATVLYLQGKYKASEQAAVKCAARLQMLNLPVKQALALIIAARSTLADHRLLTSQDYLEQAIEIAHNVDVPILTYQAQYIKGQLAIAQGDRLRALAAYDAAIRELERLQGQIMVEFRADFLSDKNEVYTHAVDLCLQAGNPEIALSYAERSKSRALLAMLGHHINLRIEARSPGDQDLVDQILTLREKRDRLYRRWETGETPGSTANREEEQKGGQSARHEGRQIILETEDKIQDLWHRLLIRNADYGRDAALWQVQSHLDQTALDDTTLMVEFFSLPQGLVAFLISAKNVNAIRLPITIESVAGRQIRLQHNFNTINQAPHLVSIYTRKAKGILQQLFQDLIAPWIDQAKQFQRLIIVPHGPLHYLPFHAFYDGHQYLLEQFQVSYLPGSSFLKKRYIPPLRPINALVMGHTQDGRLFHIPNEVDAVATTLNTKPFIEQDATRERFQESAPDSQIIHVAAHGDFRPRNPLFSGLYLEDSLLTTLDIFNLRLQASLVTLSACQTGRNVVSGGDELLGLTRAFLASGAASLLLTLWPVEDRVTTALMNNIYSDLMKGEDKAVALQRAQIELIEGYGGILAAHPYYWAPFFLVGDTGPI